MKPDQEKVRDLLVDTVGLLCKNGLVFMKQLKIEGLLGITVDNTDVFIVHIDEVFPGSAELKLNSASSTKDDRATPARKVPAPVAEYNEVLAPARPHTVPLRSVPKPSRKHRSSGKSMPVKRERVEWREEAGPTASASDWNDVVDVGMSGRTEHCSLNGTDSVYLKSEADQLSKIDDELLWMNSVNDPNNSQCQMDFVSNSAQQFDSANVLDPFDVASTDESLIAKVTELSDGLESSGPRKPQQEHNNAGMTPDGGSGRRQRRTSSRRRSARNEMTAPFTDTSASILLADSDDGTNWDARAKGQYSVASDIDWGNENGLEEDQMQQQQQQQWSNWEGSGSRGAGRRAAQGSEEREKSFICQYDQCDKAFFRKDHLIRHQRIKHGKPYGVDTQVVYYCHFADCGRMFYKNASLHRHMNDAHGYVRQE